MQFSLHTQCSTRRSIFRVTGGRKKSPAGFQVRFSLHTQCSTHRSIFRVTGGEKKSPAGFQVRFSLHTQCSTRRSIFRVTGGRNFAFFTCIIKNRRLYAFGSFRFVYYYFHSLRAPFSHPEAQQVLLSGPSAPNVFACMILNTEYELRGDMAQPSPRAESAVFYLEAFAVFTALQALR